MANYTLELDYWGDLGEAAPGGVGAAHLPYQLPGNLAQHFLNAGTARFLSQKWPQRV